MIIGSDSTFPIVINETKAVGHLKKAIKEAQKPKLDAFASDALRLYPVGIEIEKSRDEPTRIHALQLRSQNLDEDEALDEEKRLSEIFREKPKEKCYILVRVPPQEGQSSPVVLICPSPSTPTLL